MALTARRSTGGFSALELIVVITLISAATAIAVPRIRDAAVRQAVRGARMAVAAQLAQARGTASHRACPGVLHLNASAVTSWVTACATNGVGLDTLGMTRLDEVYGVAMTSPVDSLVFFPTGVANAGGWLTIRFSRNGVSDSLRITPLGRAAR